MKKSQVYLMNYALQKCAKDIKYFVENFCTITTLMSAKDATFKLYPKQTRVLRRMHKERFMTVRKTRQCGGTLMIVLYSLWCALFNCNKRIGICSYNIKNSIRILARIREIYNTVELMKPDIIRNSKTEVVFSNNTSINAIPMNEYAVRGRSFDVFFMDEPAYIPNKVFDNFYNSICPMFCGTKTKCIMISTSKPGSRFNKIHNSRSKIWKKANINWWDVPGRDRQWMIGMIKSLDADIMVFEQEFGPIK